MGPGIFFYTKGMPVMLLDNLLTPFKLVNGRIGTAVDDSIYNIRRLLNKCQRTFEDFIETPNFDGSGERKLLKMLFKLLMRSCPLWANGTGVCTSWAVYNALVLEEESRTVYSFGDKRNHRAAWSQDGIAIDPSAKNALQLIDGKIKSTHDTKWMMKYVGTSDVVLCSVSSRMILIGIDSRLESNGVM
jgi:hypothetical protein